MAEKKIVVDIKENGRIHNRNEKGTALSNSVVRSIHMMLHQAFEDAVKERLISKNPTKSTTIPKRRLLVGLLKPTEHIATDSISMRA